MTPEEKEIREAERKILAESRRRRIKLSRILWGMTAAEMNAYFDKCDKEWEEKEQQWREEEQLAAAK